jgi:hypothetical protein
MLSREKKLVFIIVIITITTLLSLFMAESLLSLMNIKRYQTWLEMDERGFIKNRTSFDAFGYTFQGPTYYHFDENGSRVTAIKPKYDSSKKVLMLGDSFQFGLYLEDSLTITHKLNEKTSEKIHFINGGVGGSGTADHVWHLRTYLSKTKFNNVILLLNYDDIDRAIGKNLFVLKNNSLII